MLELLKLIPPWLWIALVVFNVIQGTVAYLILLERKIASWVQDRIGPNRVGPLGLLQPLADGLKMFVKEDYRASSADKTLFTVAPAVMIIVITVSIAVIPWGGIVQTTVPIPAGQTAQSVVPWWAGITAATADSVTYRFAFQIANLNIGVLFIVAVLSLAVYGVVVGGWASNNKYSFLGGLRATAQMISYEVPLGLSILTIVLLFGTLDLSRMVEQQAHYWAGWIPAWNAFCQPLAFFMFLVCIHAEANRAPFDLAEAEQELVGGYHTEYSSMRFGLFFLAEYAGMITTSAVCVAMFFGGWHIPWLDKIPAIGGYIDYANNPAVTDSIPVAVLRSVVFFTKIMAIITVFMWVRWSLPRFRFDQLMMLAWRALIPMSLALLAMTAVVVYLYRDHRMSGLRVDGSMAIALLVGNLVVFTLAVLISMVIPAPPPTNRRLKILDSRFTQTPLPAGLK